MECGEGGSFGDGEGDGGEFGVLGRPRRISLQFVLNGVHKRWGFPRCRLVMRLSIEKERVMRCLAGAVVLLAVGVRVGLGATVTTAVGDGADAFVQKGNAGANFGGLPELLVKNGGSDSEATDRKG